MMKKTPLLIIGLIAFMGFMNNAHAKTPFEGTAYSESAGIFYMNYSDSSGAATVIDGAITELYEMSDVNTEGADACDAQSCPITGFMWNEWIGWTLWDGEVIANGSPVPFSSDDFARVNFSADEGQTRWPVTGKIWSEKGGWILLSATASGSTVNPEGQTTGVAPSDPGFPAGHNWGVFLDTGDAGGGSEPEYRLRGYAWSQSVGWIKFGRETGDEIDFGVSTAWLPDVTAPIIGLPGTTCAEAPTLSICPSVCELDPGDPSCASVIIPPVETCAEHPAFAVCPSVCELDPGDPSCGSVNICEVEPENPVCDNVTTCADDPTLPLCAQVRATCETNPEDPSCNVPVVMVDQPYDVINGAYWFINNSPSGQITWNGIATDPDTGIRLDSLLAVKKDSALEYAGCNEPVSLGMGTSGGSLNLIIPAVGLLKNAENPYCKYHLTGKVINGAGLAYELGEGPGADGPPLVFYVRAGYIDESLSAILQPNTGTAVADGEDELGYQLELVDIAKNPILPINDAVCANCRSVEVMGRVKNQMKYNTVNRASSPGALFIRQSAGSKIGIDLAENISDPDGVSETSPLLADAITGRFPLNLVSYSPTTGLNQVEVRGFRVTDTTTLRSGDNVTDDRQLSNTGKTIAFVPALVAQNGSVSNLGTSSATLDFELKNQSQVVAQALTAMDIDTIFEFRTKDGSGATAEAQYIQSAGSSDSLYGWMDPDVPLEGAHYEIFNGARLEGELDLEGDSTILNDYATVGTDGSYAVDEIWLIPDDKIDRGDKISTLSIAKDTAVPQTINFTPAVIGDQAADMDLKVSQVIAYRLQNQPPIAPADPADFAAYFTVYRPAALIPGANMSFTGVEFKGLGAGDDIYTERDFDVVAGKPLEDLAEMMDRSAAELTLGMNACGSGTSVTATSGGDLVLATPGSCFKTRAGNSEIITYYSGTGTLELGDGSDNVLYVPANTRYTLIVKGGMNVYLKNNMAYYDNGSSFGLIVLDGGHVYVDPGPTNLVGSVFTEGSLLSYQTSSGGLYYNTNDFQDDLKNQLYWQGGIASRNTIGGAQKTPPVLPEGADCSGIGAQGNEKEKICAKRYDLNHLRNFSVQGGVTGDAGVKFSGGGSCSAAGGCQAGSLGLPTTITIAGSKILNEGADPLVSSKSLDSFFIEPARSRPLPPGFSVTSEQSFREVIR